MSTSVTVDDEPKPLVPGSQLSVTFNDNETVGVDSGCNGLFSTYDAAHGTLTEPAGGTEIACAKPLMAQEEWVMDFLVSNATYEVDGDSLTLSNDDTTIELVDEEVAIPDAALTGTQWVLEGIVSGSNETGAVASVPAGVRSTLRLARDGGTTIDYGCNVGGSKVEVAATTITFRGGATTMRFCPGPTGQTEHAVADVLDGEVRYVLDGQTLTLRSGPTALIYRAS